MLYTIAVILFVLWLVGLLTTHLLGGFAALLLELFVELFALLNREFAFAN